MGNMLVVELVIDTKDAMGANAINTMCEAIAPQVAEITGGEVVLKILSNYATRRMVRCRAIFDKEHLGGTKLSSGYSILMHLLILTLTVQLLTTRVS